MYHVKTCTAGAAAGSCTLAATGFNTLFYVVAGFTLLMAGIALLKLRPAKEL